MKVNELKNEKNFEFTNIIENKEFEKMMENAVEQRDKLILRLLMATGMRIAELHNLNIEDANTDEMTLDITSMGYHRCVDLDSETNQLLKSYIEFNNYNFLIKGNRNPGGVQPLFLNNKRRRLSIRSIQQKIQQCREKAKITKPITAHTFRRTVVKILRGKGCPEKKIMEFLGYYYSPQLTKHGLNPLAGEV